MRLGLHDAPPERGKVDELDPHQSMQVVLGFGSRGFVDMRKGLSLLGARGLLTMIALNNFSGEGMSRKVELFLDLLMVEPTTAARGRSGGQGKRSHRI